MSKLKEFKIKNQFGDVEKIFKYNPERKETIDGKIRVGQDCSYDIGSDRYKMRVKYISNTGKAFVNEEGMIFKIKDGSLEQYWVSNKYYFFNERKDSYRDPSF